MSDGPAPGEHDEAALLDAARRIVAVLRQAHVEQPDGELVAYRAHVRYLRRPDATATERMAASYLVMALTNEWEVPERLAEAEAVLTGDDPRRATVETIARRIATGTITWTQLLRLTRKPLVRSPRPAPVPVPADAIPLTQTPKRLRQLLVGRPTVAACADAFFELAQTPVAPPRGRTVDDDMCLFEWSRAGLEFTRQLSLADRDGDYLGMKHLRMEVVVDVVVSPEAAANADWSGDDLPGWIARTRAHPVLGAVAALTPAAVRVRLEAV